MIGKELLEFIEIENKRLNEHFHKDDSKKEVALLRLAKLTEEVGEVSDELLKSFYYARKHKLEKGNNLDIEIADVIIVTLLLAKNMNVDIDKALREKIKNIEAREY